jgi:hypothetical protein
MPGCRITGQCPSPGRVEEWRHTRRSGLSVAPRFLWECLTNRSVAGFHPPPRRTERADFPHSALLLASQEDLWDAANWRCFQSWFLTSIYSTPSNHFRLPLSVYPLSQVLQHFAPWELPQFIATPNPSDTFSPSFLFPVQPVIGRTCSRVFLSGTRKVSPVA